MSRRPLVGLLYNPTVPIVLDAIGERVDFIEIVPDRLWHDLGIRARHRFRRSRSAVEELRRYAQGRPLVGHGVGMSLSSTMPLDEQLLDEVVASHRTLRYRWYSEHLGMLLAPDRGIVDARPGMGLPLALDDETLDLIGGKVRRLGAALGTRVLLENSAMFSAPLHHDMSEPEFFNRLYRLTGCGMLLDLHNLHVNTRDRGIAADDYLAQLDPDIVVEIHLAGGDQSIDPRADSLSRPMLDEAWQWASTWAPRFRNLVAITYEYRESHHRRRGLGGIGHELELMQALAAGIGEARATGMT
ncbi:MAG: DUF692 family multinuclear iron-containing protein [Reyranella sp.]|uniref:DUF692 domain-containing protein n=1 Tax=Reyranella sp. TaxID=1929291 RepID=UPI003D0A030C